MLSKLFLCRRVYTYLIIYNVQYVTSIWKLQTRNLRKIATLEIKPFVNVWNDSSSRGALRVAIHPANLQPSSMLVHIRVKTDPSQTEAKHDKQILRMNDAKGNSYPGKLTIRLFAAFVLFAIFNYVFAK